MTKYTASGGKTGRPTKIAMKHIMKDAAMLRKKGYSRKLALENAWRMYRNKR